MKLDTKAIDRLIQADSRFNRFEEKFKLFLEQLKYFSEPQSPLKCVAIEVAQDSRAVTIKYRTVTLTLRMLLQLNEQNAPTARVDCTLQEPTENHSHSSLGSFTFSPLGKTSFDPDPEGDDIELDSRAIEIAVHFLTLALRQGTA